MLKKIPTAAQIHEWDQYTILHEPVSSLALMERAAARCLNQMQADYPALALKTSRINVYCGMGNNGGDGLVIARLLQQQGVKVQVYLLPTRQQGSADFELNRTRYEGNIIANEEASDSFLPANFHIDALLGSGLNKPLDGLIEKWIKQINLLAGVKLAVDIPTGLAADVETAMNWHSNTIFKADDTYTFQRPKSSFLFPETGICVGRLHIVDIDLDSRFEEQLPQKWHWKDEHLKLSFHQFIHKGNRGHACVIGGETGKAGAVTLASHAALACGSGRVTAVIPQALNNILQTAIPEVMTLPASGDQYIESIPDLASFESVAIGPGMGQHTNTLKAFHSFISTNTKPLVLDADALNMAGTLIKTHPGFRLPKGCILTPHPKEFERLFGAVGNSLDRLNKAVEMACLHGVVIVLKGAYTAVVNANGDVSFNASGNNLMATAGSGDVLTGIIVSLLAQGYAPYEAACEAVYMHGKAADMLAAEGFKHILSGQLIPKLQKI